MSESVSPLKHIGNKSLSDQAADILRRAILSGQLKPGEVLNETDLAEQLGTSRGPIREALRVLNTEGLTETEPYHGTRVQSLTRRDIEEVYSMRVLMETFAVRHILDNPDTAQLERLREHYDHMVSAAGANDFQKVTEVDRAFHDTLIQLSDHKLMASLWQTVAMRVQQIMAINNRRFSDLHEIAHNHLRIIEALETGDADIACELLRDHIVTTADVLVESWQPSDNDEANQP